MFQSDPEMVPKMLPMMAQDIARYFVASLLGLSSWAVLVLLVFATAMLFVFSLCLCFAVASLSNRGGTPEVIMQEGCIDWYVKAGNMDTHSHYVIHKSNISVPWAGMLSDYIRASWVLTIAMMHDLN